MNLDLYFRVLWRFRLLVGVGLVLAFFLALLSFARISSHGLSYRQSERWQSEGMLYVTQKGFPEGRTTPTFLPGDPKTGAPAVSTSDIGRLSSQTVLYAQLATTDKVQRLMPHRPQRADQILVAAVPAPPFSNPAILPVISIKAVATSASGAAALAGDQTDAIIRFVEEGQRASRTPVSNRVHVEEVKRPMAKTATLVGKRGKALPAIVFLAVMVATLGLAFVLENLRPGIRVIEGTAPATASPISKARRSA